MANVLFSRTDSPSTKPITDGQIIFDTSGNGKMYLDNGTTRLEMGGAINVDTTLDANSTNPIQNKGVAGVMLSELEEVRGVTKKGFLTDALATKTLDAKIGTTDISSIGDGTVTGAISDVNGKLNAKFVWTRLSNAQTDAWGNLHIDKIEKYIPILVVAFSDYIGMLYQKSSYEWYIHFMTDNQDHTIASNFTFANVMVLWVRDPNFS